MLFSYVFTSLVVYFLTYLSTSSRPWSQRLEKPDSLDC